MATTTRNWRDSGYNLTTFDSKEVYDTNLRTAETQNAEVAENGYDIDLGYYIVWKPTAEVA